MLLNIIRFWKVGLCCVVAGDALVSFGAHFNVFDPTLVPQPSFLHEAGLASALLMWLVPEVIKDWNVT